jgi:hypothetical protein
VIDTSIFCEILSVPNMCQNARTVLEALKQKATAREELMLPMATILETGNHIGQNGNGGARRRAAIRFVEQVRKALAGQSPFTATGLMDRTKLDLWLGELPDWSARVDRRGKGSGLGDLTIYKEWCELCEKFPRRRVYIWSADAQLASYDRLP